MPRKPIPRKICLPPSVMVFKPSGVPQKYLKRINLFFEELESLRLVNYEGKSQEEASVLMGVSRPTLTRIYNSALKKIVMALIEGKALYIEGGYYEYNNQWKRCNKCMALLLNNEENHSCLQTNNNKI